MCARDDDNPSSDNGPRGMIKFLSLEGSRTWTSAAIMRERTTGSLSSIVAKNSIAMSFSQKNTMFSRCSKASATKHTLIRVFQLIESYLRKSQLKLRFYDLKIRSSKRDRVILRYIAPENDRASHEDIQQASRILRAQLVSNMNEITLHPLRGFYTPKFSSEEKV